VIYNKIVSFCSSPIISKPKNLYRACQEEGTALGPIPRIGEIRSKHFAGRAIAKPLGRSALAGSRQFQAQIGKYL